MARDLLLVPRGGWAPSRADALHHQTARAVGAARAAAGGDAVSDYDDWRVDRGRAPSRFRRPLQSDLLGSCLLPWLGDWILVLTPAACHPVLSRDGSLPDGASLPGECVAAPFPARTTAAHRHWNVRRVHPAPFDPERPPTTPRHRRRGTGCRVRRCSARPVDWSCAQPPTNGSGGAGNAGVDRLGCLGARRLGRDAAPPAFHAHRRTGGAEP